MKHQRMTAYVAPGQGAIEDILQTEVDIPAVSDDGILVRVRGSSINPADIKVATRSSGARFIHSLKQPVRLGFDFSGVIERKGNDVSRLSVGDEVYGFLAYSAKTKQGSYADYVAVKASSVALKPASVSHAVAATIPTTAGTACQVLREVAPVKSGYDVLINGASGGVGCFAIQIAKLMGATVWGTGSTQSVQFIRDLGADHCVDYTQEDIKQLDHEFDVIFDAASKLSYNATRHLLKKGGVYVTLLPDLGFIRDKIVSLWSSRSCRMCVVKSRPETLSWLAGKVDSNDISVPVTQVFPQSQLKEALANFARSGARGKIGIDFS